MGLREGTVCYFINPWEWPIFSIVRKLAFKNSWIDGCLPRTKEDSHQSNCQLLKGSRFTPCCDTWLSCSPNTLERTVSTQMCDHELWWAYKTLVSEQTGEVSHKSTHSRLCLKKTKKKKEHLYLLISQFNSVPLKPHNYWSWTKNIRNPRWKGDLSSSRRIYSSLWAGGR